MSNGEEGREWQSLDWFQHSLPHDHHVAVLSVDIQPTGERFACGGVDGGITIWPLSAVWKIPKEGNISINSIRLAQIRRHSEAVNVVRWSANGRYLASGGDDREIYVHELKSGLPTLRSANDGSSHHEDWRPTKILKAHHSSVVDIAWSPDSDSPQMCSGGQDASVIVWDVHKGVVLQVLVGHQGFVKGVAWDPLGEYIASQSADNSIKIWRLEGAAKTKVNTIQDPSVFISDTAAFSARISWSPDGSKLAVASKIFKMHSQHFASLFVNRMRDWRLEVRKTCQQFKGTITVSMFNPKFFYWEGKRVQYCACVSSKGTFSILREPCDWCDDSSSQSCSQENEWIGTTTEFVQTQENITDASWAPDGHMILMVSNEGTLYRGDFGRTCLGTPVPQSVATDFSHETPLTPKSSMSERLSGRLRANRIGSDSVGKKQKRKITPLQDDAPSISSPLQCAQDSLTNGLDGPRKEHENRLNDIENRSTFVSHPHMPRFFNAPSMPTCFTFGLEYDAQGSITEICVTNSNKRREIDGIVSKLEMRKDSDIVLWEAGVDGTIVLGASSKSFVTVATTALYLQVFRRTGWHALQPLYLAAEAVYLKLHNDTVLIVGLINGEIRIWDLLTEDFISQCTLHPQMMTALVESIDVSSDGWPIVTLENGWTHMYNGKMRAWVLASKSREASEWIKNMVADDSRGSIIVQDVPVHTIQDCLAACLTAGDIGKYKHLSEQYLRHLISPPTSDENASTIFRFCMHVGQLSYLGMREFVLEILVSKILTLDFSLDGVKNRLIEELSSEKMEN